MATLPAVRFNHVYFKVADDRVFQDVRSSEFLRDSFASVRIHEVSSAKGSWSGIYISGENTYLEIFSTQEDASQVGLAFSTEQSGQIVGVHEELARKVENVEAVEMNHILQSDRSKRDWYRSFHVIPATSQRAAWIMELEPKFLSFIFGEAHDGASIDRKTFLHRLYNPMRLLKDIRRIRVEVSGVEGLDKCLRLVGLGTNETGVYSDQCTRIEIVESKFPRGLVEIDFQLRENFGPKELAFGDSLMSFTGGDLASWQLYP